MRKELDITPMGPTKKAYTPPRVTAQVIALEQGIAAGSASINPSGSTDATKEEWGTGTDRDGNLDW